MDVKLFSLCKQELSETQEGKKYILECVKSFFPDCEGFSAFTSQKRMLLAISQSLRAADVVIVAVQGNMYNATKRLLSAALDLKTAKSAEVANALKPLLETGKIKQNVFDVNIRFPAGAEILPTESFLNCGFALTSGGQHIIYLPIDAPRADEVVFGSLYDYLADICEENRNEIAFGRRHASIIKRTAEKLDAETMKAAFSGEAITKHLEKFAHKKSADWCFVIDEAKQYSSLKKEELIDTARKLRDDKFVQLGVVFADIAVDEENGERFIDVAIADESGTSTMRVFAEEGESDEKFTADCIDKVLLTLYNFDKLSAVKEEDVVTKGDKALRKYLFKIAAGAVGASAVVSIIIALIMK
ncbi:MAG: hypothetical protein IJ447_08750 [Clostridia bacterium]|nr:hypothetical protein [Clostridia bacterium]